MTTHALLRAQERYGVDLSAVDIAALISDIDHGRALLLSKSEVDKAHYLVRWHGIPMRAVYVARAAAIITFLPLSPRRKYHAA